MADPWFLALLILPLGLYLWHRLSSRRGRASVLFSGGEMIDRLPSTWRTRIAPRLHLLRYPGLVLLIFALARPQTGESIQEIRSFGVDIMLILDVSGTMAERDMRRDRRQISRLSAAKQVMSGFIKGRVSDRIGLIAFATQSLTRCPLTVDYDLVALALDEIDLNLFPEDMRRTAIGNALATGVSRLWQSDAKSRVVILLTDGANTAGNIAPLTAAEIARTEKIRVHTIGFGSPGRSDVDEETLKRISEVTGGQFFRSNSLEDLQQVYDVIDDLEKSEVTVKNYQRWDEWYWWFVWAGCALILLEALLRELVCRQIP